MIQFLTDIAPCVLASLITMVIAFLFSAQVLGNQLVRIIDKQITLEKRLNGI